MRSDAQDVMTMSEIKKRKEKKKKEKQESLFSKKK